VLPTIFRRQNIQKLNLALPDHFNIDEAWKIISAAGSIRDRIFLMFLLGTGARISEAISVRVRDFTPMDSSVRIPNLKRNCGPKKRRPGPRPKQKPEPEYRTLPVKPGLAGALSQFIRDNSLALDDLIFPFSRITGWRIVQKAAKTAGINDSRCHPHTFRHTFAIQAVRSGISPIVIQQWLGQSNLFNTLIYAKATALDTRPFMGEMKLFPEDFREGAGG